MPLFTVDLEDWYHSIYPPRLWPGCREEIRENTFCLLNILEKYHVKARFYILGDIARRHEGLVESVAKHGHQLANHGMWHQPSEKGVDRDCYDASYLIMCIGQRHNQYPPYTYRSPYWKHTAMPGMTGGVFFRVLPYWLFKSYLDESQVFWIHPHDIYGTPIREGSTFLQLKRKIGLRGAEEKLHRLLSETKFDDPWRAN